MNKISSLSRLLEQLSRVHESGDRVLIDTTTIDPDEDDYPSEYLWNDLVWELDNLDKFPRYVITGTLGRWNGRKRIYPLESDDLLSLVQKALRNASNYKVSVKDGYVLIESTHHDGANEFKIYALSPKGAEYFDDVDVERITDDYVVKNPQYFSKIV